MNYQVGGSLNPEAISYVDRQADQELFHSLMMGEFCYVFNSRQMGKSSLRVRTRHRLEQAGMRCASIDMLHIGTASITPQQWYKGVMIDLLRSLDLLDQVDFKLWWQQQDDLSVVQRLGYFFEDILLRQLPRDRIFILVDEIDSALNLNFPIDDFFALIRYCYNQRAENPAYNRLTFALFGVATPSDLIRDSRWRDSAPRVPASFDRLAEKRPRTPFNIGKAIELQGFQPNEVEPLIDGLTNYVPDPHAVLSEILYWTGGQPFLTQKLCQLVAMTTGTGSIGDPADCQPCFDLPPSKEPSILLDSHPQTPSTNHCSVTELVQSHLIANWEGRDEPEHLRTIRDRLLRGACEASQLLGIYQQILLGKSVAADGSPEQVELVLSGLVIKQGGFLTIKNPIYREVFNLEWVEKQFNRLRPYSQTLEAWIASNQSDTSRLLRGQALKDAQRWASRKQLSDLDYKYLSASEVFDQQELQQDLAAERLKVLELRLFEEHQKRLQDQKDETVQQLFVEIMIVALSIALCLGITIYLQQQRTDTNQPLRSFNQTQNS